MTTLPRNTFSKNFVLPDRIYSQYSNKPKIRQWVNVTKKIASEIADGAEQVRECLDVDTATGDALEIIGRIVAVDRIKDERLLNSGVFSEPDGTNFDDKEHGFSEWSTYVNAKLNDDMLRFAIRAKIVKNSSYATQDELLDAFNFVFPSGKVFRIINHHDMSFTVEHIGVLTPLERWLIDKADFIPTPQGVRIRGFIRSFGIIEFLNDGDFDFGNEELEFLA